MKNDFGFRMSRWKLIAPLRPLKSLATFRLTMKELSMTTLLMTQLQGPALVDAISTWYIFLLQFFIAVGILKTAFTSIHPRTNPLLFMANFNMIFKRGLAELLFFSLP